MSFYNCLIRLEIVIEYDNFDGEYYEMWSKSSNRLGNKIKTIKYLLRSDILPHRS